MLGCTWNFQQKHGCLYIEGTAAFWTCLYVKKIQVLDLPVGSLCLRFKSLHIGHSTDLLKSQLDLTVLYIRFVIENFPFAKTYVTPDILLKFCHNIKR